MEIDKKIIKKLIDVLEDLKKTLNINEVINSDDPNEKEIDVSNDPTILKHLNERIEALTLDKARIKKLFPLSQ